MTTEVDCEYKDKKRILGDTGTSKPPELEEQRRKDPSDHSTQGKGSTCTNST